MAMDFRQDVFHTVQRHLDNRSIRVPTGATWNARQDDDAVHLTATLPAKALCQNFQERPPATPSYLWCLAYWYEQATTTPVRCTLITEGQPPDDAKRLRHWRRSQFLLHEYSLLLGDRFDCRPAASWAWPADPIINAPGEARGSQEKGGPLSEHNVEVHIVDTPALSASFRDQVADLTGFQRQLPVGLFDGVISDDTRWTPGGASQADLWGVSSDGATLHLFELKTRDNTPLGIVPESFYYGRLLHWIRVGLPDGRQIQGEGAGYEAARRAERIIVWLIAPRVHPLVYSRGDSPLRWLNQALEGSGLEFKILPFDLTDDREITWRADEIWPGPGAPSRD